MGSRCVAALVLLCAAAPAYAQGPARFRVQNDTLRYQTTNPFRMYWVRGTDTIGPPRRSLSVETNVWRGTAQAPEVIVRHVALDVGRRVSVDTFTVAPDGRVLAINHRPPTPDSRFDLLLRLPSVPLRVGTTWSDTVGRSGATGPAGEQRYEVTRGYRVRRLVDTLGARGVADVEARGQIRFRYGFWADSAAGKAAWIDVAGPVTEHFLFDPGQGRLLRREWTMELRGRGVPPGGTDTLPAGLLSEEVRVLDESPRVRFLLAPLPGADSSMTLRLSDEQPILLHTVERLPGRITSSLSRNDATTGVASATFAGERMREFDASWAGASPELETRRVVGKPGALLLRRSGGRDTTLSIPTEIWGVADYGMSELLGPILLALPRDGAARPISVFRPYPARWDRGEVVVEERSGMIVAWIRYEGRKQPEAMVFAHDGDYLFGENAGGDDGRRVPTDAARQGRLEAAAKDATSDARSRG